jgi:putative ATP-dependent endonuclease of the OLD family
VATMGHHQKPLIRQLKIERFRGIEKFSWNPESGVNVILGGGDVGKTTILDAIALLLNPTNTMILTDADYWHREVEKGFCVEAVMSLPEECGMNQQAKMAWPWEWDGNEPKLPKIDLESSSSSVTQPVYRLRVRGTEEFDLAFEIIQPDDTADHFSVGLRRKIGIVRLSGDDRNDRDLRLIQGSALERLLSDKTLRSRVGLKLAQSKVDEVLKEDAKEKLTRLDESFKAQALPTGLSLALTGGQGLSLNALIGLTATKHGVHLPLASWGAGTRRLAALEIAAADQAESPVTIIDELERGLEPYRQRVLMGELEKTGSQVFLTTHSSAALRATASASHWYMDSKGGIGRLPASAAAHMKRDPETFFALIAVVAEGDSEVGFVRELLERAIDSDLLKFGIWVTDGGGNDSTLQLLEGLAGSGLTFAGIADNEGRSPTRWAAIHEKLGKLLFRWPTGCLEENIIKLVPEERLEDFIKDSDGESGMRLRTLADRLGITEKEFSVIKSKSADLRKLIIEAATGAIPEEKKNADKSEKNKLKSHAGTWFKSVQGGRELAIKMFDFGLYPQLVMQLLPFLTSIRDVVLPTEVSSLPS